MKENRRDVGPLSFNKIYNTLLFLFAFFDFRCRKQECNGERFIGLNLTVSTETFQGYVSQITSLRVHCLRCDTVGTRHPFHSKHPIIVKSAWSAFECKRNVNYVRRRYVWMHWNTTCDFIMAVLKNHFITGLTAHLFCPAHSVYWHSAWCWAGVKGGDYTWGSVLLLSPDLPLRAPVQLCCSNVEERKWSCFKELLTARM